MKRIVSIQDISCLGKCALTVALPVISAMGVEAAVIPTTLLSVHTDFPEFTAHDLTPVVPDVIGHWKRAGFSFDGIYTGYLGSLAQIALISDFVDAFHTEDNFFLMDPAMGDAGALYAGLPPELPAAMARLCAKADVIIPNLTEACLLLERPYPGEDIAPADAEDILRALTERGAPRAVLTGLRFAPDQMGVMAYDRETDEVFRYAGERFPQRFYGTGDCFASACVGALARGLTFPAALHLALDFTLESIRRSLSDPDRRWYGVNFEEAIPLLVDRLRAPGAPE